MAFGFGFGSGQRRRKSAASPTAPLAAIHSTGYRATTVANLNTYRPGTDVILSRKGYDGSYTSPGGVPTPILLTGIGETIKVRHRTRNAYTDDGSEPVWSNTDAALSTYVYSTDSVPGMSGANGSAEASPKPTAGWAWYDRSVVGNSVNLQVVAYHRNGRNGQGVACVVFRATDGTNTVYQIVTTSSVLSTPSGHPFSDVRIEGYECNLDITSLADDAEITVNAKVYPWIGDASSVLDSADYSNEYEFSPRKYLKHTARLANPPLAYVSSTGADATVDANGQAAGITKVSTTAATAKANPFLTVASAIQALKAASAITGIGGTAYTDGCEIRLIDGVTWNTSPSTGAYSFAGALTITRDPASANRAAATLTFGASAVNTRQAWLRFKDIKIVRTANVQASTASGKFIFDGVDMDNGGIASAFSGPGSVLFHCSVNLANAASQYWSPGTTQSALVRGCQISSGAASNGEAGVFIGNKGVAPSASATRQLTRSIVADNFYASAATAPFGIWPNGLLTFSGAVFVGNVQECIASGAGLTSPNPSADAGTTHMQNFICHNNTMAGAWLAGRQNWLYDDTIGTSRNHKLHLNEANVFVCLTSKSDYFIGFNGGGDAAECALHVNAQNILYGTDCNYLHCQWWDAGDVGQGYDTLARRWGHYGSYTYGENSSVPASRVLNDPKFKAGAATTFNGTSYSAGAGNGDYRPQRISQGDAADSPLLGKVTMPKRRYDLRGVARASSNDTIGAYA